MTYKPVTKVCKKCHKKFILGIEGTVNGCDSCTGVIRDSNNFAWYPGEKEMTVQDITTGEIETISRPG